MEEIVIGCSRFSELFWALTEHNPRGELNSIWMRVEKKINVWQRFIIMGKGSRRRYPYLR